MKSLFPQNLPGLFAVVSIGPLFPYTCPETLKYPYFPLRNLLEGSLLEELAALTVSDLAQMAFDLTKHPLASRRLLKMRDFRDPSNLYPNPKP